MGLFNIFNQKPKQETIPEVAIENISIKRLVPKCVEWKTDLINISSSNSCSVCKKYNRKTYSLFGWNKNYPKAPDFILQRKCPECDKIIGATMKL